MVVLYNYPEQAAFKRMLPKSKIYNYTKPSRVIRDKFVKQIDKIVWLYKLAPETINLQAKQAVPEIQIFSIILKTEELSDDVLRTIDKAINFPIFFELEFNNRIKLTATYKRPSEADSNKWVLDTYFESAWLPKQVERIALPVALDMEKLYEKMLRQLLPITAREGESLKTQAARITQIQNKQKEAVKLESHLKSEKQFNRKVELNALLRDINNDIDALLAKKIINRNKDG